MGERRLKASPNQARYVKAELGGTGTYMISVGHRVDGRFDETAFTTAIARLLQRHEALRTRFEIAGDVYAVVAPKPAYRYHLRRTGREEFSAFRDWALPLVFSDVDPLAPGALIRFLVTDMGSSWRFTVAAHHAITDGISRNLMNKELLELYAGAELPPARSYYEFVDTKPVGDEVRANVAAFVRDLPAPVRIFGDGHGAANGEFIERSLGDLGQGIAPLARSMGASKFGVLAAVYALGLSGYTGETKVSSFFQSAGRRSLASPNTVVGSFSNTLPLGFSVDPQKPFATFAGEVLARTKSALSLETAPILEAVIGAQKAPHVSLNLFPPEVPLTVASLTIGPREYLDRRTEFDLNLVWSEEHGTLTARAFYNAARISKVRAEQFLGFQVRLLNAALQAPHAPCEEVVRRARGGFESIAGAQTTAPEPTRRLHSAFFDRAATAPDTIAIRTSRETITYGSLAQTAREIVRGLRSAGIGDGDRVAIFAARHPLSVAAMLGVSASGASFALIDATYPVVRIKMMLDALGTDHVIEAGAGLPPEIARSVTRIAPAAGEDATIDTFEGDPRAEAYHLFTSGTTGKPKLSSHPDQTLQRFVRWQYETLGASQPITTVMMAGLAHDPNLRDVFLPLSFGGSIAIPNPSEMADPKSLRALLKSADCNVVRFGPATARLLTTGLPNGEVFPNLEAIFWGGERLPRETVSRWQELAANARQFNVFGTTETPQAFLIHEIQPGRRDGRDVPLGKPLPWCGVRLVDDGGRPVSRGEVGEIVADLADPVVGTSRRVADDPATEDRVHYTGDLGFQTTDGNIHYVGRADDQVQINGFRVEPSEVEATAELLDGIERAAVLAENDGLSLFVECGQSAWAESRIRSELGMRLPPYMVPAQIFILSDLPQTANGKIDRAALRALLASAPIRPEDSAPRETPKGPTEAAFAKVFARHSGRSEIYRDDTLSNLGADSLSSIEARVELEALGMTLPNNWQWQSLEDLAALNDVARDVDPPYRSAFRFDRTEMFVLLRCIAIISVVAFHTGFRVTGGASIVLFALAGYAFTRLQLPGVLSDGHAHRIWALMTKLLIPLVPMSLVYFGINIYRDIATPVSSLLFFRNLSPLIDTVFQPGTEPSKVLNWLWFLHAYLQMFLIIGLLLGWARLRQWLTADLWRGLVTVFMVVEGVNLLAILCVALLVGDAVEAGHLLHRTPFALLPFLVLGGLVAAAETSQRQAVTFALVAVHVGVLFQFYGDHRELWWVLALALCAAVPFVSLPTIVSKMVVAVAAYTLMIYLTHHAVFLVMFKVFGGADAARVGSMVAQICIGVLFGMLMRQVIERMGVQRIANPGQQHADG